MSLIDLHDWIQRVSSAPARLSAEDEIILKRVKSYFDEMYEIEKEDEGRDSAAESTDDMLERLDKTVERKQRVHDKYWCNTSGYYKPCSSGTDPDYDWKRVVGFHILRNGDDDGPLFLFLYGYRSLHSERPEMHCLALHVIDGQPMIDHSYF